MKIKGRKKMNKLNQKDLKILAHLRKDARMPLTKMSKKIQVPVSTIFDRLKMSESSIITKHTSLLDFTKLGYHTHANIAIKVDSEHKEELKKYLIKHQSTNSVYKINNGYDFLIEGVFKHIKNMEEFIDDLEKRFKITDKKFFFVIEDLKKEEFMSDPMMIWD